MFSETYGTIPFSQSAFLVPIIAPARGVTTSGRGISKWDNCFNPRTHEGCDTGRPESSRPYFSACCQGKRRFRERRPYGRQCRSDEAGKTFPVCRFMRTDEPGRIDGPLARDSCLFGNARFSDRDDCRYQGIPKYACDGNVMYYYSLHAVMKKPSCSDKLALELIWRDKARGDFRRVRC